ncbi:PaaX family transcriptional regulator C-terminal domain-containing protein [Streptomyces sp. NPDC088812]|uniref:PaaX family transcriptional regulator C-terminal domain-containing protein n=1 Tax=Streptomyces sp. NPDC088812 TaxID=3365905 RepID=UPI0038089D76
MADVQYVVMRANVSAEAGEVELRPLSARSVVLSLLLGTHPSELPVKDLVRLVEPFGVGGSTLRAALSRMAAAGDLRRAGAVYGLSDRLLERRRRQDDAVRPATRPWDGDWEMAVVTVTGRGPAERAELRAALTRLRLAELREGVWLRPATLLRPWPDGLSGVVRCFTARPETPTGAERQGREPGRGQEREPGRGQEREPGRGQEREPGREQGREPGRGQEREPGREQGRVQDRELAATLWPLDEWAGTARGLLAHIARAERPADRFTAHAAAVRHLLADPVLPPELLPADWPGAALRAAYTAYRRELTEAVHGRTPV